MGERGGVNGQREIFKELSRAKVISPPPPMLASSVIAFCVLCQFVRSAGMLVAQWK